MSSSVDMLLLQAFKYELENKIKTLPIEKQDEEICTVKEYLLNRINQIEGRLKKLP